MTVLIPIIFFDGVCNLCNATVAFLLRWEAQPVFRFAHLQSDYAKEHLYRFSLSEKPLDTILLIEGDNLYARSEAALNLIKYLKFPWPILKILSIIPVPLRNCIYDWIANNRYSWFGKTDQCVLPSPSTQSRFHS